MEEKAKTGATPDLSVRSCDQCEEQDKTASVYCQDCKHYLCESCLTIHAAWKGMKHHTVLTVADKLSEEVSLSHVEGQYCSEHDNKEKKFYCKTCDKPVCKDCIDSKQCCHDHDTVTLQQAADNKLQGLKEQMKECNKKKDEIQDAIDKIEKIEDEISCSADKIRCELNSKKATYMKVVESVFDTAVGDVDRLKKEHTKKLTEIKYCLKGKMTEIDSIKERGEHLVGTRSNSEIVSNCTPDLSSSFQKVSDLEVNEVDEILHQFTPNIPMPVCKYVVGYKKIGQITLSQKNVSPTGIAVTSDEKIVVSQGYYMQVGVTVYTMSGVILHKFNELFPSCVAITPDDIYVFPSANYTSCQLYSNKYKLLKKFVFNESCTATAVTVDKNGSIILGMAKNMNIDNHTISIHSSDGTVQACFAPSISPNSLAVTSKEEIVIANGQDTLQLLDYTGKCLHTTEPPSEVTTWKPTQVCCNTQDCVFVVNQGDPKAIFRFAAGRVYMGCVTTEVNDPWAIAISHDDQKLLVGDKSDGSNLVNIFQAP
ncbi:E3 ubiquitin-protein ligase TRIM45-like [Amphiura filiformis]|uniref:E3 ubiquitin-protein ligase TRIM45-like n=1 Tax=Amphiura filiformis TaxID=82378 RepID=UPI003B210E55